MFKFPVKVREMDQFEKVNKISINIYTNKNNTMVSMERSNAGLGSTYKNEFKDTKNSKAAKIDYKTLDCYQDKFRYIEN